MQASQMNRAAWILGAVAFGAAAMYMFDPLQGRRRRALARDKIYSAGVKTRKLFEKNARDLTNRAHGVLAEAKRLLPEKGDRTLH